MNRCTFCSSSAFVLVYSYPNGSALSRCLNCGVVQVLPHLASAAVTAKYHDDWKHFAPYVSQSSAHRAYFRVLLRFLEHSMQLGQKTMLDVGCATGLLVDEALQQGIHAEGIDISASAVQHGRQRHLPLHNATSASWAKKEKHTGYYDIITALSVIEHEADPAAMMQSLYMMTAAGGMVVVSTPNFNTLYRCLMGSRWVGYQHPEHLWIFTPKTITALLRDAGFTNVVVRRDFQRSYSVAYALRRLGDYIPGLRRTCSRLTSVFGSLHLPVMINPWGDMLVLARKPAM